MWIREPVYARQANAPLGSRSRGSNEVPDVVPTHWITILDKVIVSRRAWECAETRAYHLGHVPQSDGA